MTRRKREPGGGIAVHHRASPDVKRLGPEPPPEFLMRGEEARAYLDWKRASQLLVAKALAIKPLIAEREAAREELRLAGMGAPFEAATLRYRVARVHADPPEADFQATVKVVREALQRLANAAAPGSVPG